MLKPKSFDICKNAAAPMIAILDHLEVDIEISSASMETAESDGCRGTSEDNRGANKVLATI